jgi:nickel superoxide dismutase
MVVQYLAFSCLWQKLKIRNCTGEIFELLRKFVYIFITKNFTGGNMFYKFIKALDNKIHFKEAKAHCDVPCGIYDPHHAQLGALTVIRMIDLMHALEKEHPEKGIAWHNSMARYIAVKEEHAEMVKHEVRVIWGDFMKPEHAEKFPQLTGLVDKIMKLGSKARQTTDRQMGTDLLDAVNQFAEIFWEIKGVPTKKAKAPYAPAEEVVYPVL